MGANEIAKPLTSTLNGVEMLNLVILCLCYVCVTVNNNFYYGKFVRIKLHILELNQQSITHVHK